MSSSIIIDDQAFQKLKILATHSNQSIEDVLFQAVDCYYRARVLSGICDSYEALKKDPKAWEEELQERALWDATLDDGLDDL